MRLVIRVARAEDALRRVGGIPLLRRLAILGVRAGFSEVCVAGGSELAPALRGVAASLVQGCPAPALVLSASFLPERAWLGEQARRSGPEGGAVSFGGRALVTDEPVDLARDEVLSLGEPQPAPPGEEIASDADARRVEDKLLRRLVKEREGLFSRHVDRKISLAVSRRLMNTSVSPNQMTLFSVLVGLCGAALFLVPGRLFEIGGALLFLLHSILDGCDGELARLRLQESRWGGLLDYWGDNVVHVAVFAALGIGWWRETAAFWPLLAGGGAVLGTIVAAALVYCNTMRRRSAEGPLYTTVSHGRRTLLVKIADQLSHRDFIYLVVVLACFGKAEWFLVAAGVGAPAYVVLLLVIQGRQSTVGS